MKWKEAAQGIFIGVNDHAVLKCLLNQIRTFLVGSLAVVLLNEIRGMIIGIVDRPFPHNAAADRTQLIWEITGAGTYCLGNSFRLISYEKLIAMPPREYHRNRQDELNSDGSGCVMTASA